MTTTLDKFVVNVAKLPIVVGENRRTGIDTVGEVRRGDTVELDAHDEHTRKLLAKKYIRPEGEQTEQEAAQAAAEEEATQQLTKKQQLQVRAGELGAEFEEKTTIPQLEALIAEKEEALRDSRNDPTQTGVGGPDPDAK